MVVVSTTTRFERAFPPTVTALAEVRFVPVTVTAVPPAVGPELGAMPVIVAGGGMGFPELLLLQPC